MRSVEEEAAALAAAGVRRPARCGSGAGRWAGGCARWRSPKACRPGPGPDQLSAAPARDARPAADRAFPGPRGAVPVRLGHPGRLRHAGTELEAATAAIPGPVTHHWIEGKDHGMRGADAEVAGSWPSGSALSWRHGARRRAVLGVEVLELPAGRLGVGHHDEHDQDGGSGGQDGEGRREVPNGRRQQAGRRPARRPRRRRRPTPMIPVDRLRSDVGTAPGRRRPSAGPRRSRGGCRRCPTPTAASPGPE